MAGRKVISFAQVRGNIMKINVEKGEGMKIGVIMNSWIARKIVIVLNDYQLSRILGMNVHQDKDEKQSPPTSTAQPYNCTTMPLLIIFITYFPIFPACYFPLTLLQFELQTMNHPLNDSCAICSKQPQDMLLLECAHNLCLDCATELYAATQQQSLQCQICCVETLLDKETVNCLQSLVGQLLREEVKRRVEPVVPKPPKEKGLQCYEHKEKALYYCFDCQNANICSECILGSTHSGHKVMTVKKATKIMGEQLSQNSRQLEEMKGKIEEDCEWVRAKKDELVAELGERHKKLKVIFDDMIRQVTERYNQLSQELEKTSIRGIEILEGSLNSMTEKMGLIQATIQQNTVILQQNDSQHILMRFKQLQLQRESFNPEMPANLPHNYLHLSHEDNIFMELESMLQKIAWNAKSQPLKENRAELQNIVRLDASLLDQSREKLQYPDFVESHLKDKEMNQSLNKYSGIKPTSRRLQLSRSMDNATNIINKLQERIRK